MSTRLWTWRGVWQIAKYGISGITAGVIQTIFLYLLVDRLGMWYIHGVVLAYLISFVTAFILQKFWTFEDYSSKNFQRQSILYTLIAIGALTLNVALMYGLVDILHLWHIAAQIIVIGIVGTLTFLLNKKFTFYITKDNALNE